MQNITISLDEKELSQLIDLSGEVKMTTQDYAAMILTGHVLENAEHECPECGNTYRGTLCSCKAGERL